MELRHLRYFAAVAETRHFGRAAERLHLAQPALSQAVRQLEAELGTPLLTRTTRQVSLTPAGEFMYAEAVRVLTDLSASVEGVRQIAEGRRGLLRVAFTGTATWSHLPAMARLLQAELPGVALRVQADQLTPVQVEQLVAGRLDLGVLRAPVGHDALTTRTLQVEPMVLAVPHDHPLAAADDLHLGLVADEDFVAYADDHSAVNDATLRSCRDHGFTPRVRHRAPGTSVLLALVSAGLGVSLVPHSVQAYPPPGVVFRDVPGTATSELTLAWRAEDRSPLVLAALDVLADHGVLPTRGAPAEAAPSSYLPESETR